MDEEEIFRIISGQEFGELKRRFVAAADNEICEAEFCVYREIEDKLHRQNSLPCGPSGKILAK
jgi:hypothetical protein